MIVTNYAFIGLLLLGAITFAMAPIAAVKLAVFLGILAIGLVYAWARGVLRWA